MNFVVWYLINPKYAFFVVVFELKYTYFNCQVIWFWYITSHMVQFDACLRKRIENDYVFGLSKENIWLLSPFILVSCTAEAYCQLEPSSPSKVTQGSWAWISMWRKKPRGYLFSLGIFFFFFFKRPRGTIKTLLGHPCFQNVHLGTRDVNELDALA